MRSNFKAFLIGFLLPAIALAAGSVEESNNGFSAKQFFSRNYVKNYGAEKNVNSVSVSGSATVSRNTTSPIEGKGDFSISLPNNATDGVTWSLGTLDSTLNGGNCELRLNYTASSIGSNVKFGVYQGSNLIASTLALATQSVANPAVSLNAPCGDLSSATTVKLYNDTGNSGTSSLKIDHIYYGAATNVGSVAQAQFMGSIGWVATSGCTWPRTSSTLANYSADVDCDDNSRTVTGSVVDNAFSTPGQYPAFVLKNVQPGKYLIIGRGRFAKQNTSNDGCYFAFSDQTNTSAVSSIVNNGQEDGLPTISGEFNYTTGQGDVTFSVVARNQSAGACAIVVDESTTGKTNLEFSVYRFPTSSEIAYRPELQALSWSGTHGNNCGWVFTSPSYADGSDDASCTFTELGNTNFGAVATYGSSKPGVVFTPKKTGKLHIVANFFAQNNTANSTSSFKLTDGTNNSPETQLSTSSTASQFVVPMHLEWDYQVTDLTQKTIKLQGLAASGNVSVNANNGNATPPTIYWSMYYIDQNIPAPVLVGGVTSSYSGVTNLEWAKVTSTCSASPCTISSQSSSNWITNITRSSAGTYQANFPSGYSMSHCWVVGLGSTIHSSYGNSTLPTSTTYNFTTISSGIATDSQFELFCLMTR